MLSLRSAAGSEYSRIKAHPDDYDPAFEDKFVKRVDKLDPAD
jgi:hypothetical protein